MCLQLILMQQVADQLNGVSSPLMWRCYTLEYAGKACHVLTRLAETASTLFPTCSWKLSLVSSRAWKLPDAPRSVAHGCSSVRNLRSCSMLQEGGGSYQRHADWIAPCWLLVENNVGQQGCVMEA